MTWLVIVACLAAGTAGGARWLRIAQREHYLAGSVTRFAWRWWTVTPLNIGLLGLALVGVIGAVWAPWAGLLVAIAHVGPVGLTVRGVTSPLTWTPRLRRLVALAGALFVGLLLLAALSVTTWLAGLSLLLLPPLVDIALGVLGPLEHALGSRWVGMARRKLDSIGPTVVAVTGSYGKTSTKLYAAHIIAGDRRVVSTPGSFNNRMGLARAINEVLPPGTEVFVAEMGTYGPGEIAEMCQWVNPTIAAIVSIGPVHLERFGSEESIVAAKSEILDTAEIGVVCIDHPLLAALAEARARSMELIEVSTGGAGRVRVGEEAVVDEVSLGTTPEGAFRANLAVALGIGLALGIGPERMGERLADLPVAEHRQSILRPGSGLVIIDDTFNSNPAGARLGLTRLAELAAGGTTAVITPGMVELGPIQEEENRRFAEEASRVAGHLVVVGRTNRDALLRGSAGGTASVTVVDSREEAVSWVREHLGPGDAVLYENDLPDHYP